MFKSDYNLYFRTNEKNVIECDVTVTKTLFNWTMSEKYFTIMFVGKNWIYKNTKATVTDAYLIDIVTNSAIYHYKT